MKVIVATMHVLLIEFAITPGNSLIHNKNVIKVTMKFLREEIHAILKDYVGYKRNFQ